MVNTIAMKDFLYNIWSTFLTWFGKLKIMTFHFFPVLAEEKQHFVTGYDIVEFMKHVKPGDVLIRGYDNYVDGKFIPDEKGYSHAGLYIGNNLMIHSVAPCVQYIHIIDFCQADRIMVLRPKNGQEEAIAIAHELLNTPYDFDYKGDAEKLYCFELIANCYPQAEMKKVKIKKFFGIIKRDCYIAKSIYGNGFFTRVMERNNIS